MSEGRSATAEQDASEDERGRYWRHCDRMAEHLAHEAVRQMLQFPRPNPVEPIDGTSIFP